eukprot:6357074-Amphidinium_carterae.1
MEAVGTLHTQPNQAQQRASIQRLHTNSAKHGRQGFVFSPEPLQSHSATSKLQFFVVKLLVNHASEAHSALLIFVGGCCKMLTLKVTLLGPKVTDDLLPSMPSQEHHLRDAVNDHVLDCGESACASLIAAGKAQLPVHITYKGTGCDSSEEHRLVQQVLQAALDGRIP